MQVSAFRRCTALDMQKGTDLMVSNGGVIGQWTMHGLFLQMIQGFVHQDAGLQQLLLHLVKTDDSFSMRGLTAGACGFARQR